MKDNVFTVVPPQYENIALATSKLNFNMASDRQTGSLLKTLVASKRSGRILELGTGTGLATSWMVDGMDMGSKVISVENNALLLEIARQALPDKRIQFVNADGYEWIRKYAGEPFDLVFADAMPGKYDLFDETLALVKPGGFYIIDDMLPQQNWPGGHAEKVNDFIDRLEQRRDIVLTKMNWSTGIIIVTRINS